MTARGGQPLAVYTDVAEIDPADGVAMLEAAGFRVRVLHSADPADVARMAAEAHALLVGYTPIGADLLRALPELGLVATQSVGVDEVDLAACAARGVWVSNVPAAATEEVAAHALALSLALLRGLPFLGRATRAGVWDGAAERQHRLSQTTLGVVGLGRIGRRLAAQAQPLFARVLGHDAAVTADAWPAGVERVGLDELLQRSDVVSLHVPLTADTRQLIDADALARMRPGGFLVNVSRGGLVDEHALREALDSGRLAGAGLDVLSEEPPAPGHPLVGHPRTLITPHAAYRSDTSTRQYVLDQAANAVAWLEGGRPRDVVIEGNRRWRDPGDPTGAHRGAGAR